ncbi:MAG: 3-oxoacyl-ACP synthase [bacterium]|nr:3-oxoacyl-ACP synthase [bacterium]
MERPVYVTGSGTYLPGEPVPFADIDTVLGPLPDAPRRIRRWMDSTAHIMAEVLDLQYAHYAIDPDTREFTEDNVTMATKAARLALEAAGIEAGDVDLICYGSAHQDQMPTASVRIQEALGIDRCDELSIHANCTSAYKALYLAHELVRHGRNQTALVMSSSMSSSELRAEYYNQELVDKESLFLRWFLSDGAGAAMVSADPGQTRRFELESTYIESVGGNRPSLMFNKRPAYWLNPRDEYEQALHHLRQQFRNALATEVFQGEGRSIFTDGLRRMVERESVPLDKVRYFQVNMPTKHVIDMIMDECEALGIPRSSLYTKLDTLGYCGPPMVFVCLDRILRDEPFEPGDRILSFVTEVSKFMQAGYAITYVGDAR